MKYIIKSTFLEDIDAHRLFSVLFSHLKEFEILHERYWDVEKEKSVSTNSIFSSESLFNSPSFCEITKDKPLELDGQSISLFSNDKVKKLIVKLECSYESMVSLSEKLMINNPLSNLHMSFSEINNNLWEQFFKPRKTNLYEAPLLINIRKGYIEGVSADMWLGKDFWQFAYCTANDLKRCDWLKCTELDNNVLHVKAWDKPFDSVDGEQGEIQRKLLKLLFDIDQDRPHGLIERA